MSIAPTLEAERALHTAVLAWWASHRPVKWSEEDHIAQPVVNLSGPDDHALAHHAAMIARRTATPAPADVAMPLDAEGLPPLTRWTFDGGMTASAAADGQWVQFKNVAPYAERIRLLERKLATFKAEHATLKPAQSIASDEYFWELINAWIEHNFSGSRKWAIIAHIDGRTAGTAPNPVAWAVTAERGGIHKLTITKESAERKAAVWREEWPNNGCKVRPLIFGDAADPSPQSPANEAKDD